MKLKFFFTEAHHYIATDVFTYSNNSSNFTGVFEYSTQKYNDGIETIKHVNVSMHDILYVEVHNDDGSITIIPGLIKKFTVLPVQAELDKVQAELDLAKEALEKYRTQKEAKRVKIAARKKAQYAEQKGVSIPELEKLTKK